MALSWFYPTLRIFAPRELGRALRFLGIPEAEIPSIWEAILELDARIHTESSAEVAAGGGPLADVMG
jgi:hypothetical protein